MMINETFLTRIKIRNYKSIGKCDIAPGRLTVLVGRNGSGKSNFLDALRFLVEGLQTSLDHAIKARGGIDEVRRRSTGHPHNFGIEVEMNLPDSHTAVYGFEISSRPKGGFLVKSEKLDVRRPNNTKLAYFRVSNGTIGDSSLENMPKTVCTSLPRRAYLNLKVHTTPFCRWGFTT